MGPEVTSEGVSDAGGTSGIAAGPLNRLHLEGVTLSQQIAHGGEGLIGFARLADRTNLAGSVNFIDLAVLPPGVSIGRHRHGLDEEELYLVLSGAGTMWRDGEEFGVRAGDLVRNRPGGAHGLVNTGHEDLRLFVIELPVREAP